MAEDVKTLIHAEKFLIKNWIYDSNELELLNEDYHSEPQLKNRNLFGENATSDELLDATKEIIISEVQVAFNYENPTLNHTSYNDMKRGQSCSFKLFGENPSVVLTSKLTLLLNHTEFPKEEFEKWLSDNGWKLVVSPNNETSYSLECYFSRDELEDKFLK